MSKSVRSSSRYRSNRSTSSSRSRSSSGMSRRWSKLFISSGEEKDVEITKKSDEINDLNVTLENAKVRHF